MQSVPEIAPRREPSVIDGWLRPSGLSELAQRGRRDLLLIAAGAWLAPLGPVLMSLARKTGEVIASPEVVIPIATGVAISMSINVGLFAALWSGRSWARHLTTFILGVAGTAQILDGLAGNPAAGLGIVGTLVTGGMYVAGAAVLQSKAVKAFLETRQDRVRFPQLRRRIQEGDSK